MKKCSKCKKIKEDDEFVWKETGKTYASCSNCKDYIHKLERSIPAGIYAVKEKGNVIYVGESDIPYRRRKEHFSKYRGWNSVKSKSELTKAIYRGEINPTDLSFEMLHENIDSGIKYSKIRKELEIQEIEKYKPKYNITK